MQQRRVGASGLIVSAVGLGCNNFGRSGTVSETLEGTTAVIDAAIEAGVTFLDTAEMYGKEQGLSETLMGQALRGRRDEVVIATKDGHSQAPFGLSASSLSRVDPIRRHRRIQCGDQAQSSFEKSLVQRLLN